MLQLSMAMSQGTPKLNDLKQQLLLHTVLWVTGLGWCFHFVQLLYVICYVIYYVICYMIVVMWLFGLLPSEGLSGLGVQDASFPGLAGGAGSLERPPFLHEASASHSRAAGFSGDPGEAAF